jgi:hypothetical protein
VNELEFIRAQVANERSHMAATRLALGQALQARYAPAAIAEFVRAAARYLTFVVKRFNAQDLAHCRLLSARLPVQDPDRTVLTELDAALHLSEAAIAPLEQALTHDDAALSAAAQNYLEFYRRELVQRRHAIHHLFERYYGIAEWREASMVDADSILQERELFHAVQQHLPAGLELKTPSR